MTPEGKMVRLRSSDEKEFEVEAAVAMEFQSIRHMIGDDRAGGIIPLSNVTSNILTKIIDYCSKHAALDIDNNKEKEKNLKAWDADFVKVDMDTLYDLLMAAKYLEIKSLLDLLCKTVADLIKGKSLEEVRKTFKIKSDFTPEEEEKIRSENPWAFDRTNPADPQGAAHTF